TEVNVECDAQDNELLFLSWVNALVYQMAVRRLLFGRYKVVIQDGHLSATAFGETVDPAKHQPAVEIKGATFTELSVRQGDDGVWLAQCIVDV
ncbi:MAG: archease, partial [Methylomonas sp.]|nr:archease [Methylomonas sp.]